MGYIVHGLHVTCPTKAPSIPSQTTTCTEQTHYEETVSSIYDCSLCLGYHCQGRG